MAPVTLAERDAPKLLAKKLPMDIIKRRTGRPPAQPALSQFMAVARDGPPPPASNIFATEKGGLPPLPRQFRALGRDATIVESGKRCQNQQVPQSSLVGFKATAKGEHILPPQSLSFLNEIKFSTKLPPTQGGVPSPTPPLPPKEQSAHSLAAVQYEAQGEKS